MKRYALIGLLCLVPLSVALLISNTKIQGQTSVDRNQIPYTIVGTVTRGQQVIGARRPIRGWSPEESEIRPSGAVTGGVAFITTANWPNSALNIGPVEYIKINGGQTINFTTDEADVADAVKTSTLNPRLKGCLITGWKGTGARITWPAGETNPSAKYIENTIEFCHKGIAVASDQEVIGNTVRAIRDYGLYAPDGAGNVTLIANHFYGCNGRSNGSTYDGICVWMGTASGWRIVGGTMADSHYGLVAEGGSSHTTTVTGTTFFRDSICAIQLKAGSTNFIIDACTINVPPGTDDAQFNDIRGIELAGNRHKISNCIFSLDGFDASGLPGTPDAGISTAMRVTGNANVVTNTTLQDFGHPAGKARGIHIPSAINGFRADLTLWGFEDSGDDVVDIDVNTISGVHIVIRGNSSASESPGFDPTDIAQYVDIPAGWSGTLNSITLIDEADNQTVTATGGTAY
jgi:hypothetical protein